MKTYKSNTHSTDPYLPHFHIFFKATFLYIINNHRTVMSVKVKVIQHGTKLLTLPVTTYANEIKLVDAHLSAR